MNTIFVGNLDFGTTEPSIRSLFEVYGTVDRASQAPKRDTGRSRGFACVGTANHSEAEHAIAELNCME